MTNTGQAVIADVEATPARTYDEVAATRTMIDRTEKILGLKPKRLTADTAYGTGKVLAWLLGKNTMPHIPVWERYERTHVASIGLSAGATGVSGDGEPPRLAYRIDHRPLLAAMSEQNCSLWTGSERPPRGGFSVCICSIMLQHMSPLLALLRHSGMSEFSLRC